MVPLCAIGQSRPLSDSCQLFADERHEPGETLPPGRSVLAATDDAQQAQLEAVPEGRAEPQGCLVL
jgi:hypothetical protein